MDISETDLERLAQRLGEALLAKGWMLAVAESCTGGWAAQAITAIAGSSAWFDRGFVSYSNDAKRSMLNVRGDTLARYGAVSEATVREMSLGALAHSAAQVAFAISGIAGPTGGTPDKPVGTVCFAWVLPDGLVETATHRLPGDRREVRARSVQTALEGVLMRLGTVP